MLPACMRHETYINIFNHIITMQTANQDNPSENNIRMLVLHSLFFPDEARRDEARAELMGTVWEKPSAVERAVVQYAKALLGMKEHGRGLHEKKTDGRNTGGALDESQQARLLALIKDVREEAREARTSRVRDRKAAEWARKFAKQGGMQVSLRIH